MKETTGLPSTGSFRKPLAREATFLLLYFSVTYVPASFGIGLVVKVVGEHDGASTRKSTFISKSVRKLTSPTIDTRNVSGPSFPTILGLIE